MKRKLVSDITLEDIEITIRNLDNLLDTPIWKNDNQFYTTRMQLKAILLDVDDFLNETDTPEYDFADPQTVLDYYLDGDLRTLQKDLRSK